MNYGHKQFQILTKFSRKIPLKPKYSSNPIIRSLNNLLNFLKYPQSLSLYYLDFPNRDNCQSNYIDFLSTYKSTTIIFIFYYMD